MSKTVQVTADELSIINLKTTLSVGEAAAYAGMAEEKIRQLVHTKDFPCFKNGNKWCINREMLNEWLKKICSEHRQL